MKTRKFFILLILLMTLLMSSQLPSLWAEEIISGDSIENQDSKQNSDEKSDTQSEGQKDQSNTSEEKKESIEQNQNNQTNEQEKKRFNESNQINETKDPDGEKNKQSELEAEKKKQEELEKQQEAEARQKELERKLRELAEKEQELKRREDELQKKNNQLIQTDSANHHKKEIKKVENPPDSFLGYSVYLIKKSNLYAGLPLGFNMPFGDFLKTSPSFGLSAEWKLHPYVALRVAGLTGLYQAQKSVLKAAPNDLELLDETRFGIRYFYLSWQGYYPVQNYFEANFGLGYSYNSLAIDNYSFGNSGGFELNLGAYRSLFWGIELGLNFSFNFWSLSVVEVIDSSLTGGVSKFTISDAPSGGDFKMQLILRYKIF